MNGSDSTRPPSPPRRRYHFHTPGVLYVLVTLLLAIGAFNSQNNLLFASLGLAIGGLLVSGIISGGALLGLRLERPSLDPSRVGGRLVIRYRLRNTNRLMSAFGVSIAELDGDPQHKQSGADGAAGPTWPRHTGGAAIRSFVPCVPARGRGGESEARVEVEPLRRGRLTLGPVRLWSTFPFGLAKKSITFDIPAATVIHPVELPIREGVLEKLTVRALSGVGAAVAPGLGDELYGLREYVDGDNPRWIAWRRSARTGQLVVRQSTTPTPRVLWVVLRLVEGAEERRTETAIALASALIRACAREGATVGLAVPSHGIVVPPRSAPRAVTAMQERLAVLEVQKGLQAAVFPSHAVRGAANAVIHGGMLDRSFGTGRSRHIDPDDCADLLVSGEALNRALGRLALPDLARAGTDAGRGSRGVRGALRRVFGTAGITPPGGTT